MKQLEFVNNGFTIEAAEGTGAKSLSGIAVPYGVEAQVSDGRRVVIEAGALPVDGKKPKLLVEHDPQRPIGTVTARNESEDGTAMLFTAKVAGTNLGNETMLLASEGVYDSVSIGITPTKWKTIDGVMHVQAARWNEISVVNTPAFDGATITDVQASAEPEETQEEETPETQETEVAETPTPEAVVESSAPAVIPTPLFASAPKEPRLPSAAEYLAAFHVGGDVRAAAERQILDYKKWNQSPIEAAAGDETIATNLPGLLSVPVLGPVYQELAFIRPLVNALGPRAMPNPGGNSFVRPTISQHTSVAAQANELAAVTTQSMNVAANTVSKVTLGGSIDISYQSIDFTDPNGLTTVINDLAGEYLLATEGVTATNLLAAATSSGVWDLSATDFMKSLYDAAVDISTTTNRMPTHIMVSPDVWAQIGQLADTTNRPLYAYTGGTGLQGYNALGQNNVGTWTGVNPLGLELVVSSKLAAKSMIIMHNSAFEVYEQMRGMLSVEQPSTLSRLVSIFGYFATFRANAQMIRKITQA
ncbi:MAG: HK97 family phage prohead protease [Fluviibacter sp.]